MTREEMVVLQAAFDLFEYQQAINCGVPFQKRHARAYEALMSAVSELANNNDGKLELSED